jgi:hypothetical protein
MADKLHAMVADSDMFANDPQAAIHDAFLAADEEVKLQLLELELKVLMLSKKWMQHVAAFAVHA